MRVDHGGANIAVAEEFLDRADIVVGLEQMTGIAVTQCVGARSLAKRDLAWCLVVGHGSLLAGGLG